MAKKTANSGSNEGRSGEREERRDLINRSPRVRDAKNAPTPTKIDLPMKDREQVIEILQPILVAGIDLQLQAKQAHWNVKGPHFIGLHELFDKVAETAEVQNDLVAERIGQLGGLAKGTSQVVASTTTLAEYPTDITRGDDHVDALSSALAHFAAEVRKGIDDTDELEDKGTSDMLTDVVRAIDLMEWFVESHMR